MKTPFFIKYLPMGTLQHPESIFNGFSHIIKKDLPQSAALTKVLQFHYDPNAPIRALF